MTLYTFAQVRDAERIEGLLEDARMGHLAVLVAQAFHSPDKGLRRALREIDRSLRAAPGQRRRMTDADFQTQVAKLLAVSQRGNAAILAQATDPQHPVS